MFPLSANPDYKRIEQETVLNPYYDINANFADENSVEVYGTAALDQAIENVLCTEPFERLFNVSLRSPLYAMLFENANVIEKNMETVYDIVERWVPIKIDRENTDIEIGENHSLKFKLPYYYDYHGEIQKHIFRRIIGR